MEFSGLSKRVISFFSRNKLFLLFVLLYISFLTYFLRGVAVLDPDWGWRLRTGELTLHQGVSKTDPFSYSMPSFPFVDHAWIFSAFIALTYPIFSNKALSLLLVFFVFVSVHFACKRCDDVDYEHSEIEARFERWMHPITLSVLTFFLVFFSVRAQLLSWMLFSILSFLLFKKDNYSRYKYFIPLIFLFWANIHGGFFLGIFIYVYFIIFRLFINRNGNWKDILVLLISIFITLVTPYGVGGWKEVFSSIFDSRLRWTIAEWMPSITFFDLSMVFYIAMSTFMVIYRRKDIPKIQYFLFLVLLIFGISSRRNLPYYMLYSLPLTIFSINKFYMDVMKNSDSRERFHIAYKILRVFAVLMLLSQLYFAFWKYLVPKRPSAASSNFYPEKAVAYFKNNIPKEQIFSNYGWGGYLIWKLPEKKVFIDGRMPSWKQTVSDFQIEETSAYKTYLAIEKGETDFNKISDKYNIDYVLWPVDKPTFLAALERKIKKLWSKDKEKEFSFTGYLKDNDWYLIYSDGTSQIYKRFNEERI